ncbi:hypothetical protein BV898_13433 [Hypsibius exemplaris]|uniref:Uncharacterized protein n=1 Tax=Hypsibius exemplaris TaxID=2072580 RepID=A0A1W0WAU0_HYPEX|nr:hypothetical protein BV898_13433 [Hypsibius exemplaris]
MEEMIVKLALLLHVLVHSLMSYKSTEGIDIPLKIARDIVKYGIYYAATSHEIFSSTRNPSPVPKDEDAQRYIGICPAHLMRANQIPDTNTIVRRFINNTFDTAAGKISLDETGEQIVLFDVKQLNMISRMLQVLILLPF